MNEYPTIRGNTDLRMAYSFLSLALETALPIDFTVAVKRAIRKYTHRQTDDGYRAIWSDGESCVYNGAYANWIIIGAMTGPGSESQQPCREWVERIVDDVKNELSPFYPIPVFMKGNLRKVWGRDLIQEFPEKLEAQG